MSTSDEYNRYNLVQKILQKSTNNVCVDSMCAYEIRSIFERFLISYVTRSLESSNTMFSNVSITNVESKKAIEELVEKKILDNITAASHFFNVYVITPFNSFIDTKQKEVKGTAIVSVESIKFKDFEMFLSKDVMDKLRLFNKRDVVTMCLRYATMISGGQQWSIPQVQYNYLYQEFKVRNEGFASPLNSKLMGKPGARFCSMFLDTDQVFGSIGNFFKVDLNNPPDRKSSFNGWVINPPFIENILLNSANHCLDAAEFANANNQGLFIFYIMPAWYDCEAYVAMNKSPHVVHKEILRRKKYFYENNGKRITASFESAVFVISMYNDLPTRYSEICNNMKYN